MTLPAAIIRIEGVAAECEVLRAAMHHGRDDASSQPKGDSATLELVGVLPAEAAIGAAIAVLAEWAGSEIPRFAGRITDLAVAWDSVDVATATIIAVGELADMGRRIIGDAPYPAESDGTRANRAIAAAGVATDPIRSDPGTLQVLARDVDAQPALTIATDAALDGDGFLWSATDGAVLYSDANHRRGAELALELDACDVPLTVQWRQALEGVANDARVRYGTGSPQPEIHATNPASIAELGTFGASLSTRLATAADADARGQLITVRQAWPAWVIDGLGFPLEFLDAALTDELLRLEVHSLISLTGLPSSAPAASAQLWVEGWAETITGGSWLLALAVSDYCRSAPAPEWDDIAPAYTWDSMPAELTWDATTCLPPPMPTGRWADVPADMRWSTVEPALEWDEWV